MCETVNLRVTVSPCPSLVAHSSERFMEARTFDYLYMPSAQGPRHTVTITFDYIATRVHLNYD